MSTRSSARPGDQLVNSDRFTCFLSLTIPRTHSERAGWLIHDDRFCGSAGMCV